jgi:hypothetical protein
MNVQQENKRRKCPLRAKPTQNPLENQESSYQKGKKTSENWVYRHFGHDKIIIFKFSFDEYSYNTLYPQHCTDKKTVWKHFLVMKFSSAPPTRGYPERCNRSPFLTPPKPKQINATSLVDCYDMTPLDHMSPATATLDQIRYAQERGFMILKNI